MADRDAPPSAPCSAVHPSGAPCHLPAHDEPEGHRSDLRGGQRVRWWPADETQESAPLTVHPWTSEDALDEHLRDHLTDGRWHDSCPYCGRRRIHGGTGVPDGMEEVVRGRA